MQGGRDGCERSAGQGSFARASERRRADIACMCSESLRRSGGELLHASARRASERRQMCLARSVATCRLPPCSAAQRTQAVTNPLLSDILPLRSEVHRLRLLCHGGVITWKALHTTNPSRAKRGEGTLYLFLSMVLLGELRTCKALHPNRPSRAKRGEGWSPLLVLGNVRLNHNLVIVFQITPINDKTKCSLYNLLLIFCF